MSGLLRPAMLAATLLLAAYAAGQPTSASLFNVWGNVTAQVQLGRHWWLVHEQQYRRSDGISAPMQTGFLFPPEYRTGPFSVQPGYAYWLNFPYGAFRTPATQAEHRTWLQVGYKHSWGGNAMDHRLRLEQRFLERHFVSAEEVRSRGFHHVGRLRYRTRLLVPLNDRKDVKGEWQGIASQETMVRFGDEAFKGLFDQARLGLSAGVRPWDHVQVTGGYQFQYLVRSDNVRRESNHTLTLGVAVRVPRRASS